MYNRWLFDLARSDEPRGRDAGHYGPVHQLDSLRDGEGQLLEFLHAIYVCRCLRRGYGGSLDFSAGQSVSCDDDSVENFGSGFSRCS